MPLSTEAAYGLFVCAYTFELLEKLVDGQLNSWLFDFRYWLL
jgi:hypothetical protein